MAATYKGYIDHFIYRNPDNGYGVVTFISTDDGEELTCVGTFPDVNEGESLEITGEAVSHPVYGDQLKVTEYHATVPDDIEAMERYLGSGAIKGIGAAMAKRIIKKFGDDTFRVIEEEPERLAEVRGITEKKAADIAIQMASKRELREAMLFLQGYGISNTLAVRIYDFYGNRLQQVLREDPYRLAEDIDGIGFRTADEIAMRIGISMDAGGRIRCGLLYVMSTAAADGHTYLPMSVLVRRTCELLEVDEDSAMEEIQGLSLDRKLILRDMGDGAVIGSSPEDIAVFEASLFYAEQFCATKLRELGTLSDDIRIDHRREELRELLSQIEEEGGIVLDERQREAVEYSLCAGVFILTGGPGTGKTTTINTILRICDEERLDVLLAAPTGRAAKRLQEATGYEARTVHRLLEVTGRAPEGEERALRRSYSRFERNAEHPLEADVVIIDEMSMVDIRLFKALLTALLPGTHLILVGDGAQLPSVGPGQVLTDLVNSGCFKMVVLERIFRQAEESDIVMNAHRIHRGEALRLDNSSKDFFFLERDRIEPIYKHLVELTRDKLPPYLQADPYDIQVLIPMRKGPLGASTLNGILQEYLNPPSPGKREHHMGERIFREGDKVMQIRNDYQAEWEITGRNGIATDHGTGVFNGDLGRIISIDESVRSFVIRFDEGREVRYDFPGFEDIELAYAVTIHKSQGSEYPAVLIPILSGPRLLMNRNLLYTAVTRAKSLVVMLGSRDAIQGMVDNAEQLARYTGLKERVVEVFDDLDTDENRFQGESDLHALPQEMSDM